MLTFFSKCLEIFIKESLLQSSTFFKVVIYVNTTKIEMKAKKK